MTTMSAALHNGKGAMEIQRIEKPEPGPADAIVRVRQTGICGSDLLNYALMTDQEEFPWRPRGRRRDRRGGRGCGPRQGR